MKKIFTLIASLIMVLSMSAATKTIYCKMAHDWWYADGAAVGAHMWTEGGAGTTWPGVRMTPVTGETDLWSIDVDTDKYKKIIFTRVNGSGAIADYGAQTGNLDIPTNENNLYTITTSSPTWGGNPGCAGSWSTYTPDAPKTYKDITFTITANAAPQIHYWNGGDKMVGSDWENLPTMTATGNANEYTYTVKDVDEAKGVEYLLKIGNIQTPDKTTSENVIADFKDLMPEVYVKGVTGWTGDGHKMTIADDYASASVTITLAANLTADLKLTIGGTWMGDTKNAITKENNSSVFDTNGQNGSIKTDIAGDYVFTYTYADQTLTVTYPTEEIEVAVDCYVTGNTALTGEDWVLDSENLKMTKVEGTEKYTYTFTALPANTAFELKVVYAGSQKGFSSLSEAIDGVTANGDNICFTLEETGDVTVTYDAETEKIALTGNFSIPETFDYYIVGSFNGDNPADEAHGMTLDGTVYKATVTLAAGDNTLKVTKGSWDPTWGYTELGAAYEEVSDAGEYNNIKITLAEEKEITVIFDATAGKITFEGLTEEVVTPAEDVTVYFINSGNWAEVACYYWGGTDAPAWPGAQMTANGEVFEAEGWNVYKVTFPGDNTSCIFNDNKAEGATQTGNLEVHDGQYYCYENGIWYERLADVDPLDTRVYLKGDMNEWCNNGYCDMFRKEDMSETVAYRTTWLDANTTYEFKIESAGAWLSCAQAVTKDNCTDLTFEEGGNNCTITTEYAGDYTFIWDMTTNKLSVVYPDPKANPSVLDLMVTNMVFDGDKTFSGTDNEYGIVFNLVLGEEKEGVFALDASSTVDFGGTLFTEVTGTITPDMSMGMPTAATAVVYGFLDGMYFQLNVEMSAGGSAATPVEIWDGVATPNDGTGELTISATWEGDDVYVAVPGFDYTNYECPEVWFYIGGTTWETASIAAYGPATITVEDGGVLVEGTVISGITGTQYELMVFGLLPVEETPDYTRAVASGSYGTICLPSGSSKVEGAKFYEVTYKKDGYIYADEVTTLVAGMPYIFHATSTEIKVYYNETTATAGSNNGVYGTFSDITDGDAGTTGNVLEGKYLLVAGPKVQKCGGNCSLAANRAYFVVDEITTQEKQEIPGRQRIALGCQDENQATGLDNITENGAVAPALQGTYDILGRQLSEPAANGFYIINGKKMFVAK